MPDNQGISDALATQSVPQCFTKREIILSKTPEPHLSKNARYILAEVAMYNASRALGIDMVPTTIILKKKNDMGQNIVSCCSAWIEAANVKIHNAQDLKNIITPGEWSQMNIFHFIFGQYDRHFGNIIIEKNTRKLYLIDNEAVANVDQYVFAYSADKNLSCPWVGGVGDFIAKKPNPEPEAQDFLTLLATKQDPRMLHEAFPDVDIPTKIDIDRGYCRIWHNRLWRQFYILEDYIAAPFSDFIAATFLEKISSLTEHELVSLWPEIPFEISKEGAEEYATLIKKFTQKTLERIDMVAHYFLEHPENIFSDL
jgi:hypothetical protein